jgi:hypothetical protein
MEDGELQLETLIRVEEPLDSLHSADLLENALELGLQDSS